MSKILADGFRLNRIGAFPFCFGKLFGCYLIGYVKSISVLLSVLASG